MKRMILIVLSFTLISLFISGCSENNIKNKDGIEIVMTDTGNNFYCYDGLEVIQFGTGKYNNGAFYNIDSNNKLVQCKSNNKIKEDEVRIKTKCYKKRLLVEFGTSQYNNGYFYKKTFDGNIISCTNEVRIEKRI